MNPRYQKRLELAVARLPNTHGKDRDDMEEIIKTYKHLLVCKLPHRVIDGVYSPCKEYGHQKVT